MLSAYTTNKRDMRDYFGIVTDMETHAIEYTESFEEACWLANRMAEETGGEFGAFGPVDYEIYGMYKERRSLMGRKSYLAEQYKLMSIKTSDLFTIEESEIFKKILGVKQKLNDNKDKLEKSKKKKKDCVLTTEQVKEIKNENKSLNAEKKQLNDELKKLIKKNNKRKDFVRELNIAAVCDTRSAIDGVYPPAIEWDNLKLSRQIQEFCSEGSRLLKVPIDSVCWEKIIIAWKSIDILEHIVLHGFTAKILIDGRIVEKKYRFMTASAGQLRRDKVQFISVDGYDRIYKSAYAGLTPEMINAKGGMNVNKLLAYYGLSFSATERWYWENDGKIEKFSIRHCLVIPDFKWDVPGEMDYIFRVDKDGNKIDAKDHETEDVNYKIQRGRREEEINHCDGIGMKLPIIDEHSWCRHNVKIDGVWQEVEEQIHSKNDMVRGPWLKGLLTEFDYIEFCKEHNVPCVVKDFWGKEHDLEKEEIWVLFTESQLKLAAFYDSWEDYCQKWEENDCWICRTNYDEVDYSVLESGHYDSKKHIDRALKPSPVNYQFLQTLASMSEEEMENSMTETRTKIKNIATSKFAMLQTMGCDKPKTALQRCLKMYPAILRDGYCRDTIRDKKKQMVLNGKSGVLYCDNRRVYAIPDMYAACEFWFLGIEKPEGILHDQEIYCRLYEDKEELDVLRSPHLYMEHALRKNVVRPELQKWFKTGGIYTSTHDLISRILQFDVDGDMLNTCREPWMLAAAKRTIDDYKIVPLYYDPIKAPKEQVNNQTMFNGLARAHNSSNIGEISNSLTKLWNRFETVPESSIRAAAFITYMNNRVIDAAKTGDECKYPAEVKTLIDKATGDKAYDEADKQNPDLGKMPYFFQFSKNGRRADGTPGESCAKSQVSVMNKLCILACNDGLHGGLVNDIKMNFKNVPNFNYRMLMNHIEGPINDAVRQAFLDEAAKAQSGIIASEIFSQENLEDLSTQVNSKFALGAAKIKLEILKICSLEEAFDTIVRDLYAGKNIDKITYKRFFWEIFGDIIEKNLKENYKHHHECEECGQLIPDWDTEHTHQDEDETHYKCIDCLQIISYNDRKNLRCPTCGKKADEANKRSKARKRYEEQKQKAAEEKMKALRAKILADLQYDIKIG